MFKDVKGYEGLYTINESGVVKNKKGHVLRYAESNTGYLRVALQDENGDRKNYSIHRLVASVFLDNPDNLEVVMHKDNDKMNNHVSNLKWGSQSENIQQAFDEGRKQSPRCHNYSYYEVYSPDHKDNIICHGYPEISELIGYKEISIKNMVGYGGKHTHPINLGDYKGYMIQRVKMRSENSPIYYYLRDQEC